VHGFDAESARERLAAGAYDVAHAVPRDRHAIERLRALFAAALDYPAPTSPPDFGVSLPQAPDHAARGPYFVFLPGTNWRSKRWAPTHWAALAKPLLAAGRRVVVPAHDDREYAALRRMKVDRPEIEILLRPSMSDMLAAIAHAAGVVGVDTGLTHLAAAFGTPTVALFGPTSPALTGLTGPRQAALASDMFCSPCIRRHCPLVGTLGGTSPCMAGLRPDAVALALDDLVKSSETSDAPRLSAV
jgi:heptosyltransferase-1